MPMWGQSDGSSVHIQLRSRRLCRHELRRMHSDPHGLLTLFRQFLQPFVDLGQRKTRPRLISGDPGAMLSAVACSSIRQPSADRAIAGFAKGDRSRSGFNQLRAGEPPAQSRHLGHRTRRAEEVALCLAAVCRAQPLQLILGLHPLCERNHPKGGAEIGYRGHDRVAVTALAQALDKGAVYFDLAERKAPQIVERRIAGAEIVHGDADTKVPKSCAGSPVSSGSRRA